MIQRKKLIEVALPLDAINKASAREKSIRHGHPSTLHLWWARRPLAAARAVIFAQMVDDPSTYVDVLRSDADKLRRAKQALKKRLAEHEAKLEGAPDVHEPEPTLDDVLAEQERDRLFELIEELVQWENTTNEKVLQRASDEIWQSWRRACADNVDHPRAKELFDRHKLPAFHDPFAGGGALPLEAQRLGLEAYASDLNPVAVLINKAMIEIPPRFAGQPPVNPESRNKKSLLEREWRGAEGLAEDVRYYGKWMRHEAEKRIGHLYPKIAVTEEMAKERPDLKKYAGRELTVIAWLWARTVKSPNPAFADVEVPLVSNFMLSTKKGKEAYIKPLIGADGYRFTVKVGKPSDRLSSAGTKLGRGANFRCLMSGTPIGGDYVKKEGRAGRMGARMMAIVAEGDRERVFLAPTAEHEAAAHDASPEWKPDIEFFQQALGFRVGNYGMTRWGDLFSERQLIALTTFSHLVEEVRERAQSDALDQEELWPQAYRNGSEKAYAKAVATFLGFGVSKSSDYWSNLCIWRSDPKNLGVGHVFSKQTLSMVWDFAEGNPFSTSSGNWTLNLEWVSKVLSQLGLFGVGRVTSADARSVRLHGPAVVSTDPPYYDNVGYADLSDFFYVWLRRSLRDILPELFTTLAAPKAEELVATPARHGSREEADAFFLDGMTHAMRRLASDSHPGFAVTIYYAFKQSEDDSESDIASTGWETFLNAVIRAGFSITGTWPIRTELGNRTRSMSSNALASSIVLVCRPHVANAPTATRRDLVSALKSELPSALTHLQRSNIAPVDLAQAAIGPGMAVFTRYSQVLDAEGKPISVRDALALINRTLDQVQAEQEGDFDTDSRWALAWFEQHGFEESEFGSAETLSKAKNTSVAGMVEAGILESRRGKVRLLRPKELPVKWDPATDPRLTAWETVHHLIRALGSGGEAAAAELAAKLGARAEVARELAYRLYTLCERKKRAAEALAYNGLVQSFPEIARLARETATPREEQAVLFGTEE